ncbi:UDP-N-acetylglucosamine 1-carboxyvinyltransferase [Aristaeella hokkaidonensis]|jgi:UDP-N-acetylglucosamine 1-carboxyvinyltransferase|uniref:UDP-N-acetylglucosamine 1-carboxyvinyltransferase n=1 Tax=Aristaeella hokkaidonensis TaxID=3046382 RepID=A0AC61N7D0_9FIRM|nr:UDP-N-acetylglucosamine 1-carboxyvinyltransferase [Aristaeella hokkaidonensis]MBQ6289453.1 UDP-N-acetylglucosamine 1-carboxyvinyltransferase [Clostridia bacterium]QTE69924.1 UDP-N-acetylglucosamine 1-carboxyvinyltransferase [Clostridiales bacterium FE2011]QTE73858.1 UDP-N-acetylglucosamine 1-carboxyvinyltransferase [Clostridiales bacterium FE2010]QUC66491.1 UDP-N-acetylglucosamine 1-carboxyvinyltransferase [Aristaeella hokkaidonensis]SNT94092.1 UDP-N-acetylglucosamine 1-carboxyvinyltransfer
MGKERMLITGGHALEGEVRVSGGKNTAVAVIPATLLSDEPCTIENLPDIEDVHALADILVELGAKVDYEPGRCMHVDPRPAEGVEISYHNAQRLRASYYLLGALLGRCGKARVPTPGGCEIGSRPVDQHLKGFRSIGAEAEEIGGMLTAEGTLTGGDVFFDMVTVGATVNVMLAAVKAKGQTFIYNAAKEPHIVDLANFLNSMGAKIKGAGTDIIRIRGVQRLHGSTYAVIPDQIETGTLMIAAAATGGDVIIDGCIPTHMDALSAKLLEMGVKVTDSDDAIRVHVVGPRRAINVKTQVYPGFPTDLQQPMSALLTTAKGTSLVTETIFEQRFRHLDEIRRMGAHVRVMDRTAIIEGVPELYGAPMTASDLRAGAALIVAALMARGTSEIYEPHYIDRGYEHIEDKLRSLGAEIRRESAL